jgi:cytochrome b
MDRPIEPTGGRPGAREIAVWDPLVRLVHWGLALTILANAVFTDADGQLHEWIGYAALALVLVRLFWGASAPAPPGSAPFRRLPRGRGASCRT